MRAPRCSIVIPTKNAMKTVRTVLTAVFEQEYAEGYEVLVIDSGSEDGTLEAVDEYPARLLQIPPAEFNHGGTRNLGAAQTQGEFIAFLTHDAQPAGPHWLSALMLPFDTDPSVAGCFGPHRPYPGCDPIDARNLVRHFANFGANVSIVRITSEDDYRARQGSYDFFSNNNSALRRSVWTRYPFPIADMSEDQRWAQTILRAGYAKAYAPDAVVFHSHSYSAREWFRRWYDEFVSYRDLESPVQMRSLLKALGYAAVTSWEDVRFLRHVLPPGLPMTRAQGRAVRNNLARAAGAYLGSNYPRIPRRLRARLSMQRRLIGRRA